MSNPGHQAALPPFERGCRTSGVLLHVTSLPSPYGIGDVGPAAFAWVDQLHDAGQKWWQALPLGPIGCGNSPYSALSSFAGNVLLVSPDLLIKDGLLSPSDCEEGRRLPSNAVDFNAVVAFKHRLLDKAWRNFDPSAHRSLWADFERFCAEEAHWLDDYALFRALKARLGGAQLLDWPEDLLRRSPLALARARRDLADDIYESRFGQFLISRQGNSLKQYAHDRGVMLIGDLPFFVSLDSSDVWANPECFQLEANLRPRFVAGVPPDYFSAEGQLWGNPVYDWEALRRSDYRWCIDRLKSLLAHVDLIRLDHFRAFCAAWHVPPTAKTAELGHWIPGPGAAFFDAIRAELGHLPFIAEDLGTITPDVVALRDQFKLPGIRVFQFGFDGNPGNPHLPHNCVPNTVAYTGTHDNNTTRGWFESVPEHVRQAARNYASKAGAATGEIAWDCIRSVWPSPAGLVIAPLQDLLNLGAEGRMNVPGVATGNWRWRCTEEMLKPAIFERLRELTISAGRMAETKAELQPQKFYLENQTNMKATKLLHNLGQSLWLDNITRDLLSSGTLKRYIDELSVTGLTSNPTIFDHAIKNSKAYDVAIRARSVQGKSGEPLFFDLALQDITRAADLFRPIFDQTNGLDGWVSLEVSPVLAYDAASTLAAAKELRARADRPNIFIKIPGTKEGLPAIEEAIFAGIPINVTLLFSREQYLAAADAFMCGIERRIAAGLKPEVASVASVFVSRWDGAVAGKVPPALNNQLGIAMANRTYKAYRELLASPRWHRAYNAGAWPQRLLWASTGTKDPKASDLLYIKALAAPFTVNTMPEAALLALADHGELGSILSADGGDCETVLARFSEAGVKLEALAAQLQADGAKAFMKSWEELLAVIASKSSALKKGERHAISVS